jgi:hypothetical protein
MIRWRVLLGFVAGAMLIASSAAHSLLGWTQLRASLAKSEAPADLVTGLSIGWHFAGVAMLAFGCIVLTIFADLLRRRSVSVRPALVIAVVYVAFGIWALIISDNDPFFYVFIVPGFLLAVAAWPSDDTKSPRIGV